MLDSLWKMALVGFMFWVLFAVPTVFLFGWLAMLLLGVLGLSVGFWTAVAGVSVVYLAVSLLRVIG